MALDDPFDDKPRRPRLKPLGKLVLYGGGAATLTFVGVAGFLWFWRPPTHFPKLLPPDTVAIVELRPTVRALAGLPMLQRAYPEYFRTKEMLELREKLRHDWGLVLESDVLPWLGGEAGAAMLPGEANRRSDGGVVGAIFARDGVRARAAMAKALKHREKLGDAVVAGAHDRVTYALVTPPDATGAYAVGFVAGAVTFASDEATMRAHIERARRHGPSLAGTEAYQAVDRALPRDSLFTGFIAGGGAGEAALRQAQQPAMAAWAQGLRGAGFGVAPYGDGVAMTGVVSIDPARMDPAVRDQLAVGGTYTDPGRLAHAPADALAAGSVRVPPAAQALLRENWRGYQRQLPAAAAGSLQTLGLQVERDVLSWLPGDMAMVAVPGEGGGFAGYLGHVPDEPEVAEAAMGRIAAAIDRGTTGMPYVQGTEDVDGKPWHVLRERFTGREVAAYGPVGAEWRFTWGPGMLARVKAPGPGLGTVEAFKQVEANMPRHPVARFYMDTRASWQLTRPLLPMSTAELDRGMASVRAIGAGWGTNRFAEDGILTGTFFLLAAPPATEDAPI